MAEEHARRCTQQTAIHNWPKALVKNASSDRREKHTIECAGTVRCSESQSSPASSKQKAHSCLEQWKACVRESSAISVCASVESHGDGCVRPRLQTVCGNQYP